jgi:hypothetical protein
VAAQLQTLPAYGANGRSAVNQFEGFPERLPPRPKLAQQGAGGLKMAASSPKPDKGFVMDYVTVTSTYTNYTFQGDTTYYITGWVTLNGTTTIEGGAVVKFLDNSSAYALDLEGPLVCQTSPYHPAVLTSKNDNSAGSTISGSSGSPSTGSSDYYLLPDYGSATTVSNVRFCYAYSGLAPFFSAGQIDAWDCQFLDCNMAINNYSTSDLHLHNVLFAGGSYGVVFQNETINLTAEQLTSDTSVFWDYSWQKPNLFLTNCIIKGSFNTNANTAPSTNCVAFVSSSSTFQSVAGGNYYLADSSTCRDAGTSDLNTNILADIGQKTTFPPMLLTSNFSASLALYPQAQRDTDTPDLGYHYDPLDYVWSNLTINSSVTLTLTNGVAVGVWGGTGITLGDAAQLISQGTPVTLNRLAPCALVQEQPLTNMTKLMDSAFTYGVGATINLRFTDLPMLGGTAYYLDFTENTASGSTVGPLTFQDCQLRGGQLFIMFGGNSVPVYSTMLFNLNNNLLERCVYDLTRWAYAPAIVTNNVYNNLFWGGAINLEYLLSDLDSPPYSTGPWNWYDNLFVNNSLSAYGTEDDYYLLYYYDYLVDGYNGFVNTSGFEVSAGGDVTPSSTDFQVGALGKYYYPTNGGNLSSLLHVGSTTADQLGLFHYTMITTPGYEGFSQVSIGFHYVAVDANGNPLDSNGDGIPDYLADSNGNGVFNSGVDLAAWASGTTNSDSTGAVGLKVYTPLK